MRNGYCGFGYSARHSRNNTDWPAVGIFAQRGKNRPNRVG
jgi:tRNA (adenine37-N6)-methyltransferase